MAFTSAKTEDRLISRINEMSELELCTFLEKLNELISDRRQRHLINQCFSVDFEELEREHSEYRGKLEHIEMCYMDTKEDDLESLKHFYLEVGCDMPI
jgi:CRISPR/Cas system-associated protein Cas10 (large subunit of type III CRISPR-Cas system)